MVSNQSKEIIEKAINSDEFINRLAKGFDLLPCIKKIFDFDDIIPLEALRKVLDDRIAQLNIQHWFEHVGQG